MSKQLEFSVLEAIPVAVLVEKEIALLEKDLEREADKGGRIARGIERDLIKLRGVLAKLDSVYTLYATETNLEASHL